MAAAFGLPVVVLFGASDPEIWGPWRTRRARSCRSPPNPADVIDALTRLQGGRMNELLRPARLRAAICRRTSPASVILMADRRRMPPASWPLLVGPILYQVLDPAPRRPRSALHGPHLPPPILSEQRRARLRSTTSGPWSPSRCSASSSSRASAIISATT